MNKQKVLKIIGWVAFVLGLLIVRNIDSDSPAGSLLSAGVVLLGAIMAIWSFNSWVKSDR